MEEFILSVQGPRFKILALCQVKVCAVSSCQSIFSKPSPKSLRTINYTLPYTKVSVDSYILNRNFAGGRNVKYGPMNPPRCVLTLWTSIWAVFTEPVWQLSGPKTLFLSWFWLSLLHPSHVTQPFCLSRRDCARTHALAHAHRLALRCECAGIKVSLVLLEHLHYIMEKGNLVVYLSACNVAQGGWSGELIGAAI